MRWIGSNTQPKHSGTIGDMGIFSFFPTKTLGAYGDAGMIVTNNEKIAVEVYAEYFKKKDYKTIENYKIQRSEVFRQYGWEIMYFNEIEVNEENILIKLKEVNK
jgi:dTDP-4-amino-4,6-dideoxygalactose transaminase